MLFLTRAGLCFAGVVVARDVEEDDEAEADELVDELEPLLPQAATPSDNSAMPTATSYFKRYGNAPSARASHRRGLARPGGDRPRGLL